MTKYIFEKLQLRSLTLIWALAILVFPGCLDKSFAGKSDLPLLRHNSWMHSSGITQIDLNREGNILVSSSRDKTVRVWDIKTHKFIFELRPPINFELSGKEGTLNSVAIIPDGKILATAGWTQGDGASYFIYLFDIFSRKMIRRIGGHQTPIYFLSYSLDGKYLVVLMDTGFGMRIYRTNDWAIVAEDTNYEKRSYWASFDKKNRLITSSMDGWLRLYDNNFKLLKKQKAPGGDEPFKVAFSPDGEMVAVGFTDSTKVNVLSGNDLTFLYAPYTDDVTEGNFSGISWSADGRFLYGGGQFKLAKDRWGMRYWADAGKGIAKDVNVSGNTIVDIRPLPSGGVVFGTLDPFIGFLDANGKLNYANQGIEENHKGHADFRSIRNNFLTSYTGKIIQFSYEVLGQEPKVFSISSGNFIPKSDLKETLQPPLLSVEGLSITNWENDRKPLINEIPLQLEPQETSRCLAIAPNHEDFVIGAERDIYSFNRRDSGRHKWRTATESTVWGINITGNGQIVVAALGDGTIHWYSMKDGHELLAFFPHPDRKRWALWKSDSGHFNISPGGEDILGWHVNQGWNQEAIFYPIGLFQNDYYKPESIELALEANLKNREQREASENNVVTLSEEDLNNIPPNVKIDFPKTNRKVKISEISVRVTVRSKSPIKAVKAYVDGRPAAVRSTFRLNTSKEGKEIVENWSLMVGIPPQDSKISVIALNEKENPSDEDTISIQWEGKPAALQRSLNILAIGVSEYKQKDLIPKLNWAHKDANDLAEFFIKQEGLIYKKVNHRILRNDEAIAEDIRTNLGWIKNNTKLEDLAIIFIAGHGVSFDNKTYHFLAYDYSPDEGKHENTIISFTTLLETTMSIPGKVILILDTCRDGLLFGNQDWVKAYSAFVIQISNKQNGGIVFSATSGKQYSQEIPQNGRFTGRLLEGLKGAAAHQNDDEITIALLEYHVRKWVEKDTNMRQVPAVAKTGLIPDFPISKRQKNLDLTQN